MQIDAEGGNADRYTGSLALFIPREDIDKLHYHQLNPVSDRARLGYHPNKSQGGKEREVQAMSPQEVQAQDKRELEKEQAATVPARVFVPNTDIFETNWWQSVVPEKPGTDKANVRPRRGRYSPHRRPPQFRQIRKYAAGLQRT